MRFPLKMLVFVAAALWISAFIMFAIGATNPSLAVFRLAAIPDAVIATALTILSIWRWTNGVE